jgi:transposase
MGKPLSLDLRFRLVAAVATDSSRRANADRFGVSAATSVRWVHAANTAGSILAKPQGGDTRSHRIEAFAAVILATVEARKDISRVELAEMLRADLGASFAPRTGWRCLDRHAMTLKKSTARSRAGTPSADPSIELRSTEPLVSFARRRRAAQGLVPRPA